MKFFARSVPMALVFSLLLAAASAGPCHASEPVSITESDSTRMDIPKSPAASVNTSVKVWVRLKDKGPAGHGQGGQGPTVNREYEDRPLFPAYLDTLKAMGFTCDARLKWQNLVSGHVDPILLAKLRALPFVAEVSLFPRKAKASLPLPRFPMAWNPRLLKKSEAVGIDYGAGRALMESLHVDRIHEWMAAKGVKPGQGMRIAVIDADFHLGAPFYDDLFSQERIRDQWDFVAGKPQAVNRDFGESHGAECLSLIGGNLPGTLVGVAPQAQFLLYRSEDEIHESYVEEDYVAAAIERAVDSGAQVISISLGYRYEYDSEPDLPFSDLDGHTRPSSVAALLAARRNVVVSVAMGNLPGTSHIPFTPSLTAPADADSILGVGIADGSHRKCSYSCTGPSADGRVKPDIVSLGLGGSCTVHVAHTSAATAAVDQLAGTSFAAPVIAGIAALLRQAQPAFSAEAIRQAMIATADHVNHPDSGLGNGVVDAWAALRLIQGDSIPSLSSEGWVRLYHAGGLTPLFIPWESGRPLPSLQLLDLSGRRIAVTMQVTGPTLQIQPRQDLRTGVYLARIR